MPRSTRLLFIFSITLTVIVFGLIGMIFYVNLTQKPTNRTSITPTPIQDSREQTQKHIEEKPLFTTVNPTYTEKLKREPFWDKLPYYTPHFVVEYKDSDDKLVITTAHPVEKAAEFKAEALNWLQQNGAKLSSLRIEFTTPK